MEGKSMVKLSHMVAFLLVASMFQPLMARDVNDEIEVLQFSDICPGKHSWPELVGKPVWTAKETIEKENAAAKVVVLLPNMPMTRDFICGRVFVLVDWNLIVEKTPTMEVCCTTQA